MPPAHARRARHELDDTRTATTITAAGAFGSVLLLAAAVAPAAAQTAPITLEPLDPIGCVDCEGPAAFGVIRAVALTREGGVVVADRDPPMIWVFDAAGAPARSFGRGGEGPGEFGFVSGIAALPDGGILVSDMMTPRLTAFGPDGALRGTTRLDAPIMRLRASPDGRHIVAQAAEWATMSAAVHLVDATGAVVATPLPTTAGRILDAEGRPVAPGLLSMAVDTEGHVAVAGSYTYRIPVLDRTGAEVAVVARDIPRTERTDAEIRELADALSLGPGAREAIAAGGRAADAPPAPEVDPLRPHFAPGALDRDGDGRLWVRTARGGPGRTLFDVFAPGGEFLGELGVDVEIGAWSVGRDLLVGVTEDPELGVNSVVRWRLVGSHPGVPDQRVTRSIDGSRNDRR